MIVEDKLTVDNVEDNGGDYFPKRVSLFKIGCLSTLILMGFWLAVSLYIGFIWRRMVVVPDVQKPPEVSVDAGNSCKKKIKRIKKGIYPPKGFIAITEKEINSLFYSGYKPLSLDAMAVKIERGDLNVVFTVIPMKSSLVANMYGVLVKRFGFFWSFKRYFDSIRFRIKLAVSFWIRKDGAADVTVKKLVVGTQDFPAELLSDIFKRLFPQYRTFLRLRGTEKIVAERGEILFFHHPEKAKY